MIYAYSSKNQNIKIFTLKINSYLAIIFYMETWLYWCRHYHCRKIQVGKCKKSTSFWIFTNVSRQPHTYPILVHSRRGIVSSLCRTCVGHRGQAGVCKLLNKCPTRQYLCDNYHLPCVSVGRGIQWPQLLKWKTLHMSFQMLYSKMKIIYNCKNSPTLFRRWWEDGGHSCLVTVTPKAVLPSLLR